jgi:demethylmenaquinone methyltransferase/2-methoxy-6-polyprenyl-1,4-benzoquinol methylase
MWTQRLVQSVGRLLALDAAAETVAIAKQRVRTSRATFMIGNVFDWAPGDEARFDTIFMAFWLSHVPRSHWVRFLERIGRWLAPDGRVLLVDECGPRSPAERMGVTVDNGMTTELRPLESGAIHRVVKEDLTPAILTEALAEAGWAIEIDLDRDDWLLAVLSR